MSMLRPASPCRGLDGQRKPDLGDGRFLNPILAGDHPDPSVLKDGPDYYMVHSSFDSTPGLLIWHSRDLVNWRPIGPALRRNVGTVWAPDLTKHADRYYIYFPALGSHGTTNMVVHADDVRGPWSDPIDLQIGNIDPGHAVDHHGRRFLFMSGGAMVALDESGLAVAGPVRKVYEGWRYPAEWDVECFAQEGPKILRHGQYYYMVLAEGGTSGPPTSHMVIMARSKRLEGPWENSPYNPIVRTRSADEAWWSKGHATLVEGPDNRHWYLLYHAYENGFYNLGRQTLLEPVTWTEDGWVKAGIVDVARPIAIPEGGETGPHGFALSDDFSTDKFGMQWAFFRPPVDGRPRHRYEDRALVVQALGTTPKDCSPLAFVCGDHAYEVEVEIETAGDSSAGLLVFYSERLFAGLGFSRRRLLEHRYGDTFEFDRPEPISSRFFLRLRNDRHVITTWHSSDGSTWTKHWMQFEVSGYHHNVAGGFLSLRPALYAAGAGEVKYRNFRYRALA
ncbi:MAG TPA: family 43 glycosylhydrolase [Polyangiaceae bacterium]|nr:family 43 glycosylhydrolase [Polyangiaceae bacterium]